MNMIVKINVKNIKTTKKGNPLQIFLLLLQTVLWSTEGGRLKCHQNDCIFGTVCLGSQCVVLPCDTDENCPNNHRCLNLLPNSPGDSRCVHNSDSFELTIKRISKVAGNQECQSDVDCKKNQVCLLPEKNSPERGTCRTKYKKCATNADCRDSGLTCLKSSDASKESFCLCANIYEETGGCGPPCSRSSQCPQKCQVCHDGMCVVTPGIQKCDLESEKVCKPTAQKLCNLGMNYQCCVDCDCISRCEGVFCNPNNGMCEGPPPWFCKTKNTNNKIQKQLGYGTDSLLCRGHHNCDKNECCLVGLGKCSNQDLSCKDECYTLSRNTIKIIYKDNNSCSCYCNGEDVTSDTACAAGFSTSSTISYDENGNCKCDCEIKKL